MSGFVGSNGVIYSNGQRMAMFSKISSVRSNLFAKKKPKVAGPFIGDPSVLSDEEYDKLLKSGARVIYDKKEYVPTLPHILDKDEYARMKERGFIGVQTVAPRQEDVETPGGLYTVYYNSLGMPFITDQKFHEVSKPYPMPYSPVLRPLTILSEDFDKETGMYHAIGKRPDYSEEIYIQTKSIPDYLSKEGVSGIRRLQKLLSESEYADKFLTIGGAEMAKDVEPLKRSDISVKDIQGAVSTYVGTIPVPQKWGIERDSKKEEKIDKKIKEALGENVEASKADEAEKPSTVKQFTIESSEAIAGGIVRIPEEVVKEVPKLETVEIGYTGRPSWYEYGPMIFDDSGLYDVSVSVPQIEIVDVYGQH